MSVCGGLGSRKKGRGLSHGQGFKGFQVEGTAPATECRDPGNEKTVVCEFYLLSIRLFWGGNRLPDKILSSQRTAFLWAVTGLRIALLMSKGLSQSSLSG